MAVFATKRFVNWRDLQGQDLSSPRREEAMDFLLVVSKISVVIGVTVIVENEFSVRDKNVRPSKARVGQKQKRAIARVWIRVQKSCGQNMAGSGGKKGPVWSVPRSSHILFLFGAAKNHTNPVLKRSMISRRSRKANSVVRRSSTAASWTQFVFRVATTLGFSFFGFLTSFF